MTVLAKTAAALVFAYGASALGGCTDGVMCRTVKANGLVFDCRMSASTATSGVKETVIFLHGFPEWSAMFMPTMRLLAPLAHPSVACNLRGYSDGARPDTVESYRYDNMINDVFAIADAVNSTSFPTDTFHLVGHDHGALLGWNVATDVGRSGRVLSYASLSIPHPQAFSRGLIGTDADHRQQVASQYFSIFVLQKSASIHLDFLFNTMGKTSSTAGVTGEFKTPEDFQHALWWYNGALDYGIMSLPPSFTLPQLLKTGPAGAVAASLRAIYGGGGKPGVVASKVVPNATVPTIYVCGNQDTAILCTLPFSLATKEFTSADYTYVETNCGHNVLSCSDPTETSTAQNAIIALIQRTSRA